MAFAYRILAVLLSCCLFVPAAAAHPRGPSAPYSVSVRDAQGRELPTFHHGGTTFVLGTYGARYTVHVENRTGRRVEAVVTVDGRDVISGRVGDYVGQRGYLIEPHDRVVIEGFRQSLNRVAAFRFTSPRDSYSSRMGTPQNVGIIGVAIFPERAREVIVAPRRPSPYGGGRGARSAPAPRDEAPAAADGYAALEESERKASRAEGAIAPRARRNNLGTRYGESLHSAAEEVPFRRAHATRPAAVITLRYDDRAGLLARGIAIEPKRPRRVCGPEAFPGQRFAPPPPADCGD